MYCSICEIEIDEEIDYRNVNGRIICDTCFDENYHYCSRCDTIIHENDTYYSECGDPLCNDCRDDENTYDENCPDNPEVSEEEIKEVVELANQWLNDDSPRRYNISIRTGDFMLSDLRKQIGLILNPIYVFGLYDRTEYQISVSSDLLDTVNTFIEQHNLNWNVHEGIGTKRLGLSYSIRLNEYETVLALLKQITEGKLCVV